MRTGPDLPEKCRSPRPATLRRRRTRILVYGLALARTVERRERATTPDAVTGSPINAVVARMVMRKSQIATSLSRR